MHDVCNVMHLSSGHKTLGSKSEKLLSPYLHITVQQVQSAAIIHHVMVHKQQKHLVISNGTSQNGSMFMSSFLSFFLCLVPLQFLLSGSFHLLCCPTTMRRLWFQ